MINHSLIPVRGARRRIAIVALCRDVAARGSASRPQLERFARDESPATYKWPVKPFDRQHPVRGSFGDPRTLFKGAAHRYGVMSGHGSFSLHRGIDISAPNGRPVYPVMSGVVRYADHEWVRVDSGGGRAFEYWHIHVARPPRRPGRGVRDGSRPRHGPGDARAPDRAPGRAGRQSARYLATSAPIATTRRPRVTSIALRGTEPARRSPPESA